MSREKIERVAEDRVAVIAYRVTREGDEVLEEATEDDPLVYLHGHSQIDGWLEKLLADREAGALFEVDLPPEARVDASASASSGPITSRRR